MDRRKQKERIKTEKEMKNGLGGKRMDRRSQKELTRMGN